MRTRLRVGTFNLGNLFAWVSVKGRRRRRRALAVRDACGEVIRRASPDVLALQEVSDAVALEAFNRSYLKSAYSHLAVARGVKQGIHLAVLSKRPLIDAQSLDDLELRDEDGERLVDLQRRPLTLRRHLLRVDLGFGSAKSGEDSAGRIRLYVAHLKSHRPLDRRRFEIDTAAYRRAESEAVAAQIDGDLRDGRRVILAGDFNDEDTASTLSPLMDHPSLFDPLTEDIGDPEARWTAKWRRFGRRRFDYVLLSESLRPSYVAGSVAIERRDPAAYASDHRLLSLDLRLGSAPPRPGAPGGRDDS